MDLTDPQALQIACTACRAQPGSLCQEKGKPYPQLHRARRRDAHGASPIESAQKTGRRAKRDVAADKQYRAALGAGRGEPLPKTIGVAASAGSGRGGNKHKNAKKRTGRQPIVGATADQPRRSAKAPDGPAAVAGRSGARGSGQQAITESTCPMCVKQIAIGAVVRERDGRLLHHRCASELDGIERTRRAVLSGETFRSKRASDWRRGASPGSARSRY